MTRTGLTRFGNAQLIKSSILSAAAAAIPFIKKYQSLQPVKMERKIMRVRKPLKPYKVRKSRKRKGKSNAVKKIAKKVRKLEQRQKEGEVTWIDKYEGSTSLTSNAGKVAYSDAYGMLTSAIETLAGRLQVYDNATSTFVSGGFAAGTQDKEVVIDDAYSQVRIKNNGGSTAAVTVYIVSAKVRSDTGALVDLTASTANVAVNPPTMDLTNRLIYPNDLPTFKEKWTIHETKKFVLSAGQESVVKHSSKNIKWRDQVPYGTVMDPRLKTFQFLIRVEGVLGHKLQPYEVGYQDVTVDVAFKQVLKCHYEGGIQATRLYVSDVTFSGANNTLYEYTNDIEKQLRDV